MELQSNRNTLMPIKLPGNRIILMSARIVTINDLQKKLEGDEENFGQMLSNYLNEISETRKLELEAEAEERIEAKISEEWYNQLQIGDSGQKTDTSMFEAITILQLEAEKYLNGPHRPDKSDDIEAELDTDVRFVSVNKVRIPYCNATIADIKVNIDPEATPSKRSLDQQVRDTLGTVESQQKRAKTYNETVLHVINLLRIRPVDRLVFMTLFNARANERDIDRGCVLFLNTRSDAIY